MRISELARRAGVTVHALRHYERLGLLLPAYRAGRLSITRMTDALEERAAALDQEIARLQALRAQVVEHADWLRAQRREQRAGTEPKKAKQAPWPGAKEKRR